jgi:hypothetical protein
VFQVHAAGSDGAVDVRADHRQAQKIILNIQSHMSSQFHPPERTSKINNLATESPKPSTIRQLCGF